jgi:hypothetical protein
MKLILIIVIFVFIVAGSIIADYQWRRWMARQRHNHDDHS